MAKKIQLQSKASPVGRAAVTPSRGQSFLDSLGAFGEMLQTGTQVLQAENEEQFQAGIESAMAGYDEAKLPYKSKAYVRGYMEYSAKADAAKFEDVANLVMQRYPDRPQDWHKLFRMSLENNYSDLVLTTKTRQGSDTYLKHFNKAKNEVLNKIDMKAREAVIETSHNMNNYNRTIAMSKAMIDYGEGRGTVEGLEKQIGELSNTLKGKTDDVVMGLISNAAIGSKQIKPFMSLKNPQGVEYSKLYASKFQSITRALQAQNQQDKYLVQKQTETLSNEVLKYLDENPEKVMVSEIGGFVAGRASELGLTVADKDTVMRMVTNNIRTDMAIKADRRKQNEVEISGAKSSGFSIAAPILRKIRSGAIMTNKDLHDATLELTGDELYNISMAYGNDFSFTKILQQERKERVDVTIKSLTDIHMNDPELLAIIKQPATSFRRMTVAGKDFVAEVKQALKGHLNTVADNYLLYGAELVDKDGKDISLRKVLDEEAKMFIDKQKTAYQERPSSSGGSTQVSPENTEEKTLEKKSFLDKIFGGKG